MKLVVIAIITAKEGYQENINNGLAELIEPTLKEAGCINYDLHTDNENPLIFAFHETWESEDHLDRHLESDHIKAFQSTSTDWIESVQMHRMTMH